MPNTVRSAVAARGNYRPDIDGLRAIAVLSVLGYHAFPHAVPGGFTGVDIFFVVSGYLICGLIYAELRRAPFSFRGFYARRFRRIFPALGLVLGACLIYGWFALAPDEYRELGKQVAAGAGCSANMLFWYEAGYFDGRAAVKPLLHLWSLGVEEQFYLLWPVVIVLTWGRRGWLICAAGLTILASFVANVVLTHTQPSAAFYLPVTRFWELLLGGLLAYLLTDSSVSDVHGAGDARIPNSRVAFIVTALGALGLLLIAVSLVMINRARPFPGWWAMVPVVGTALVISTPTAWLNRKVLATPIMVGIGLISYPLYLWHWVLLTFGRIANYGDDLPKLWRIDMLACSFLLAWATYRLVEKPIRFSPNRQLLPRAVIASVAACGLAGLLAYGSDGAAFRYAPQIRPFAAARYDDDRSFYEDIAYRGGRCFLDPTDVDFAALASRCVDRDDGASRLLVVWGDSHAASLYPGLRAQIPRGSYRIAQFTASACPPLLGLAQPDRPNCEDFNDAVFSQLHTLKPAVVILEAHWARYADAAHNFDALALRRTVEQLERIGVDRVVVMGSLPSWKIYQPRAAFEVWRRQGTMVARSRLFLDPAVFAADNQVRQAVAASGAVFVSPLALLCNSSGCLLSADPHRPTPVAWDNDHLSLAGSSLLVALALKAISG
jgi:peptidoglycan/LPS O-acetylase OafA/YrhL